MDHTTESLSIQIGNQNTSVDDFIDARHDATKLQRALFIGGTTEAAGAVFLALFKEPRGVFLHGKVLFYVYYGILVAVVLFGAMEVLAGFWVSGEPDRRRTKGKAILWASVVPLVLVAGLGGVAILK